MLTRLSSATVLSPRAAVTGLFLVNGATFGSWVARIPDVTRQLGLSEWQLGMALFGIAVGAVAAMPTIAPAVRRFGSRRVCRSAAFAFCAALPLLGLTWNLPSLAVALVLFGAGNGALDVSMNDHGGRLEQRLHQPIMGSLHAAFSAGGAVGALAGGGIAALEWTPRTHFAVAGVVLAATAGWAARHLATLPAPTPTPGETGPRASVSPTLLMLMLLGLCAALAEGAISDWSALYLVDTLGTSSGLGAVGFVAFSALMILGRLTQDRLVRRYEPTTIRRLGGALAATGMITALITDEPGVAIAAFGTVGLGLAAVFPIAISAASRIPGTTTANAIAAISSTGYTALLAGPPLIGLLADAITLRGALWTVVGALLVITAIPACPPRAPAARSNLHHQPAERSPQ